MQTLTRLLSRLWRLMFVPGYTQRASRQQSVDSPCFSSEYADCEKNPRRRDRLSYLSRTAGRGAPTDPSDIAFCAWMYYLN